MEPLARTVPQFVFQIGPTQGHKKFLADEFKSSATISTEKLKIGGFHRDGTVDNV